MLHELSVIKHNYSTLMFTESWYSGWVLQNVDFSHLHRQCGLTRDGPIFPTATVNLIITNQGKEIKNIAGTSLERGGGASRLSHTSIK